VTLGALIEANADPSTQAIVFHESITDVESLYLKAVDHGLPVVLEHGKLADTLRADSIEAFREGLARAIISVKSLVEGFNVPSADLGVIAASSGSVRQRIQSLGRLLRRKEGGRTARILVLYVRDTEDERIYETADWDHVLGVDRSRYFHWARPDTGWWADGLAEVGEPPRIFRPPSSEIDAAILDVGGPYPGRADGIDVRVDQQGNLRADDGTLLVAPQELVARTLEVSPYRRAHITLAGQLIARADTDGEPDWRYLGPLQVVATPAGRAAGTIRLTLQRSGGRRRIARAMGSRGEVRFALGVDNGGTDAGAHARQALLAWIQSIESERHITIRDFCWDGDVDYWVEVGGERITHPPGLAPLEFRESDLRIQAGDRPAT
jgi:hypothetical protein